MRDVGQKAKEAGESVGYLARIMRTVNKELLSLLKETQETVIMVTHLIEEAIELADRIAVLTPRPGKIEKIIINHLPRPRERRSEEFFCLEDELYKLIEP